MTIAGGLQLLIERRTKVIDGIVVVWILTSEGPLTSVYVSHNTTNLSLSLLLLLKVLSNTLKLSDFLHQELILTLQLVSFQPEVGKRILHNIRNLNLLLITLLQTLIEHI